jgi:hypothetical protein
MLLFLSGRLLRGAQPELMDTLIQYSKDGDDNRLLALMSENTFLMEDEEIEDLPCNEEEVHLISCPSTLDLFIFVPQFQNQLNFVPQI